MTSFVPKGQVDLAVADSEKAEVWIEEVKQMMHSNEHPNLSLLGMALEAGFNSKATFNRAFKKLENCTPTEYMKR